MQKLLGLAVSINLLFMIGCGTNNSDSTGPGSSGTVGIKNLGGYVLCSPSINVSGQDHPENTFAISLDSSGQPCLTQVKSYHWTNHPMFSCGSHFRSERTVTGRTAYLFASYHDQAAPQADQINFPGDPLGMDSFNAWSTHLEGVDPDAVDLKRDLNENAVHLNCSRHDL